MKIKWGLECKAISTAQKMWDEMISLWSASVVRFQLFNVCFYKEAFILVLLPHFPSAKVSVGGMLQSWSTGFALEALQLTGRQLVIRYFKF